MISYHTISLKSSDICCRAGQQMRMRAACSNVRYEYFSHFSDDRPNFSKFTWLAIDVNPNILHEWITYLPSWN